MEGAYKFKTDTTSCGKHLFCVYWSEIHFPSRFDTYPMSSLFYGSLIKIHFYSDLYIQTHKVQHFTTALFHLQHGGEFCTEVTSVLGAVFLPVRGGDTVLGIGIARFSSVSFRTSKWLTSWVRKRLLCLFVRCRGTGR